MENFYNDIKKITINNKSVEYKVFLNFISNEDNLNTLKNNFHKYSANLVELAELILSWDWSLHSDYNCDTQADCYLYDDSDSEDNEPDDYSSSEDEEDDRESSSSSEANIDDYDLPDDTGEAIDELNYIFTDEQLQHKRRTYEELERNGDDTYSKGVYEDYMTGKELLKKAHDEEDAQLEEETDEDEEEDKKEYLQSRFDDYENGDSTSKDEGWHPSDVISPEAKRKIDETDDIEEKINIYESELDEVDEREDDAASKWRYCEILYPNIKELVDTYVPREQIAVNFEKLFNDYNFDIKNKEDTAIIEQLYDNFHVICLYLKATIKDTEELSHLGSSIAVAEIGMEQSRTDMIINKRKFKRLCLEIAQDFKTDVKFDAEALEILQTVAEEYLIEKFNKSAGNLKRRFDTDTLLPSDLYAALRD